MAVGQCMDSYSQLFESFLIELETCWTFPPKHTPEEAKQDSPDGSKAECVGRDGRKERWQR